MIHRFTTLITETLSLADLAAVLLFFFAVLMMTHLIERKASARPSTARLMSIRRQRWMRGMAARDVRIMDAQLLALQHRGAGFFASASMIAIGGLIALIGATDQLLGIANDFAGDTSERQRAIWELKLLFILCVIVVALMKFIWSQRLYAYCAILIGATPEHTMPDSIDTADEAAHVNSAAGRSFNRGLRLVYFAIAALAWMLGPFPFAIATLLTVAMLARREFYSATRRCLAGEPPRD